jgi:hypothetical protein
MTPVTVRLTPSNASLEGDLYIMCSTSTPSTWVRSRALSTLRANSQGAGLPEAVTFLPSASGTCGVVVVTEAGTGTYTLSRT